MFKTKAIIILIISLSFLTGNSQEIANLQQLEIESELLNQKRPILVYTPKEYNERNLVAFDVIYVFDSQHRESFDLVHSLLSFTSNKQFIVVGIASPSYPELEYYRNDDYLPKPIYVDIDHYRAQKPNAENFWHYVKDEVFTLIEKNYRTTNRRFCIGHSLSASFVLDRAIKESETFTGFISISPNLAYDNYRLANDFTGFDFISNETKFLYISQANELTTWREDWKIGYEKIKSFINERDSIGNYQINTNEFPNKNHWNTYLTSLTESLENLSSFLEKNQLSPKGELKEVKFKIKVPDKNDEAFITGNQNAFGKWNPSMVKLKKTSDFEREIVLNVQFPIEFKITRGSWDSQAFTDQTTNDGENIVINKIKADTIDLKVIVWNDRQN